MNLILLATLNRLIYFVPWKRLPVHSLTSVHTSKIIVFSTRLPKNHLDRVENQVEWPYGFVKFLCSMLRMLRISNVVMTTWYASSWRKIDCVQTEIYCSSHHTFHHTPYVPPKPLLWTMRHKLQHSSPERLSPLFVPKRRQLIYNGGWWLECTYWWLESHSWW